MKFLIGVTVGLVIFFSFNLFAYRTASPPIITDFNKDSAVRLNNFLLDLWQLTNGRYNLDIVTSNPDGSLKGDVGDMLLFNNSGTYYLEINVTGLTVWKGVALSDTP